jgi:uncharacterized DUF497 family protein
MLICSASGNHAHPLNQIKHQISFQDAQVAFADDHRVVARDLAHSEAEDRFYRIGKVRGDSIDVKCGNPCTLRLRLAVFL